MKDIYNDILFPYQKKVVDDSHKSKEYGLFLDMGLGKTFISESIVQMRKKKKLLVIAPKSKILDWTRDVKNDLGMKAIVLDGSKQSDEKKLSDFKEGSIIVNYERVAIRSVLEILDKDFIVIYDEAHNIKTRTSRQGKWAFEASKKCKDILLLTGTPISQGDVRQWYNLLRVMGSNMKYSTFEKQFAIVEEVKKEGKFWKRYLGSKNLEQLHAAINTKSIFMKTEDGDIKLPEQVFTDIHLSVDKKRIYNLIEKERIYKDEIIIETAGILFLRLRQYATGFIENISGTSNHKKVALKELIESTEENLLIFYNFNQELKDIKEVAAKFDLDIFEINGAVKNIENINPKRRYIVCGQYQSASAGINMQMINNTVYYSPPLSSSNYEQSLKRTHRIGQEKTCFYYRFITNGTIEEKIYNTLKSGKDYTQKLFESGK